MWQLVQVNGGSVDSNAVSPTARAKHAICSNQDGHIYLFAGKSVNILFKDLWRFDAEQNHWEEIKCSGDHPPNLQEHTMVAWDNKLFVFGGEVGYNSNDAPLWHLDLATCSWTKFSSVHSSSPGISGTHPTGRSGHTCVIHDNCMHVYGGYQQLKGSLSEMWTFDLFTEQWSLVSGPCVTSIQPPARHLHSAVLYQNEMFIYGGMSNLQAKSDFWKWNFTNKRWTKIKSNKGPGELYHHTAIKAFNCMFVFGGERNGQLLQELWRFNFISENWDKINTEGMLPSPRSQHTAIANPFLDINLWDLCSNHSGSNGSSGTNACNASNCSQCNHQQDTCQCKCSDAHLNTNKSDSMCFDQCSEKSIIDCQKQSDIKSESNELSKQEEDKKNKKNKHRNKENKCDCGHGNEGSIRKFLRRKIGNSKLVRSISSNSYNISHHSSCNSQRNQLNNLQSGSNETSANGNQKCHCTNCHHHSNKQYLTESTSLVNSSTSDTLANTKEFEETLADEKSLNLQISGNLVESDKQSRKYDIGHAPCSASPIREIDNADLELFNRLNRLEQELAEVPSKTFDIKKTRPKSELIAELINLEDDINDSWDGIDLKRHSVHESMSYYSLCFPSPHYLPPTSTFSNQVPKLSEPIKSCNNQSGYTFSNSTYNSLRKNRPKSYNQTSIFYENEDNEEDQNNHHSNEITDSNITETNNTVSNSICSPTSLTSTMDSMSQSMTQSMTQSMSQSSGYQSLVEDSCTFDNQIGSSSEPGLPKQDNNAYTVIQRTNNYKKNANFYASKRYSRDLSNFEMKSPYKDNNESAVLIKQNDTVVRNCRNNEATENISSSETNETITQSDGACNLKSQMPCSNSSLDIKLRSNLSLCKLPRARSWDRKLMKSYAISKELNGEISNGKNLWNQINVIKEVIVPSSPAFKQMKNEQRNACKNEESKTFAKFSKKISKKNQDRDYQLCMFVFGGKGLAAENSGKQPISIWKLYI